MTAALLLATLLAGAPSIDGLYLLGGGDTLTIEGGAWTVTRRSEWQPPVSHPQAPCAVHVDAGTLAIDAACFGAPVRGPIGLRPSGIDPPLGRWENVDGSKETLELYESQGASTHGATLALGRSGPDLAHFHEWPPLPSGGVSWRTHTFDCMMDHGDFPELVLLVALSDGSLLRAHTPGGHGHFGPMTVARFRHVPGSERRVVTVAEALKERLLFAQPHRLPDGGAWLRLQSTAPLRVHIPAGTAFTDGGVRVVTTTPKTIVMPPRTALGLQP